jgi:hypothetical protein
MRKKSWNWIILNDHQSIQETCKSGDTPRIGGIRFPNGQTKKLKKISVILLFIFAK